MSEPFLQVPEECAHRRVVLHLRGRFERSAVVLSPTPRSNAWCSPVTTPHICNHRQALNGQVPVPLLRGPYGWVLCCEPAPHCQHEIVVRPSQPRAARAVFIPVLCCL